MSQMRVKAQAKDGKTEVRVLVRHPMEMSRKDKDSGETIPAHYITEVSCEHNGEVVFTAQWTAGISKNPYLSFDFVGGEAGEKLTITWKDNQDQNETQEVEIS
jgi:sulfur-oxidizing protein SoxZ